MDHIGKGLFSVVAGELIGPNPYFFLKVTKSLLDICMYIYLLIRSGPRALSDQIVHHNQASDTIYLLE